MGPGESGDTTGIWAISILGSAPRKLRDDAGRAAVSPDGSHIAYVGGRSQSELWVMGAAGEQPSKLLQAGGGEHFLQVQWSPDGQRIAYLKSGSRAEKSETTIESVSMSGGISTVALAAPGIGSFCWSADKRLLYSLQEPSSNTEDMNLWELRVDASGKPLGQSQRITSWAGLSVQDLSVTADGKRLVFVNAGLQSDVYAGELDPRGTLASPRRLTLDERNDVPSAWLSDSQTLLFESDRNGNWDVFKQRLQSRKAQEFILGPGDQRGARPTPDGSSILYWDSAKDQNGNVIWRLLRMPAGGGAPELVLQANRESAFRCPGARGQCVLSELDSSSGELTFTSLDPLRGKGKELTRVAVDASSKALWDISPDGSTLAVANSDEQGSSIRVIELQNGAAQTISIGSRRLTGLSWSPDARGLFATSSSVRGSALLYVPLKGAISELWETKTPLGTPLVSPDRRTVAFSVTTYNSNAWMLENF